MNVVCKNCGNHFKGKYCSNCAQKANAGRLRVSNVIDELWHNFTHTDRTALGLIYALIQNPGRVIREYIAGKRKKYFNPYTFFLLSSGILIFITMHVFKYEDKLYRINNEFGQFTSSQYTAIVLCCFPFLAGICRLLFFRKGYNFSEWVVFFVFSYCIINLLQIIIELLYFPLIKYHFGYRAYTEFLSYVVLFVILVSFIRPSGIINWLQCVFCIVLVFFFVELLANFIALWLIYGIPIKVLFKKRHLINN